MVGHLFTASMIYLALVIQPSLANDMTAASLRPWLPGIALVVAIVFTNRLSGLVWAGLLGLGVDCLAIDRPGAHIAIAIVIASGLLVVQDGEKSCGALASITFVFAATFIWRSLAAIIHSALDRHRLDWDLLMTTAMLDAASTAGLVASAIVVKALISSLIQPNRRPSLRLANRWSMLTDK